MTLRIIRALVWKEAMRYWHNRPSLVLAMLLVLVSFLVSVGSSAGAGGNGDQPGQCHVLYWDKDGFVEHLMRRVPAGLDVRFAHASEYADKNDVIWYPAKDPQRPVIGIQIRPGNWDPPGGSLFEPVAAPDGPVRYKVWYWYTKDRAEALLPFRDWFQAELRAYFRSEPGIVEADIAMETTEGRIRPIHRVVTALVAAGVYLLCFHLHIVITSEERERRTQLAQMLAPVSVGDVLAAKACFYIPATLLLAAIVLAANAPATLTRVHFWVSMVAACTGYLAIGMIICGITRSQSAAGLTALTYFMLVGVIIYLSSILPPLLPLRFLLLDYYMMQSIHYNLVDAPPDWVPLLTGMSVVLAAAWATAAWLFTRRGWR